MSRADDILELIDAGLGRAAGWAAPIKSTSCSRAGCPGVLVDGHDFCGPCLDWLRGDDDTDPVALPEVSAPNPEPVDQVVAWVATFGELPS